MFYADFILSEGIIYVCQFFGGEKIFFSLPILTLVFVFGVDATVADPTRWGGSIHTAYVPAHQGLPTGKLYTLRLNLI